MLWRPCRKRLQRPHSSLASEQLMYYWPQAYAQLQQLFADIRAALVALQPPPVDPKKGV